MERMTSDQAVASGAATLILFAATAAAGYSLAAGTAAARPATPPGAALQGLVVGHALMIDGRRPFRNAA
jgi:hypothetical protein